MRNIKIKIKWYSRLLILLICFFLIGFLLIKQLFINGSSTFFHGLNLNGFLSGIEFSHKETTNVVRSYPDSSQLLTPLSEILNSPFPLPDLMNLVEYGIAAGGNLPYANQTQLDQYFILLKELGVSWLRWDFDWGTIQSKDQNLFDWSATDRLSDTAAKYGIKTLGLITYTPKWAQTAVCQGTFACAPADPEAFGIFAGQVAARYAPKGLHYWEIWNEPNYHLFWKPAPNINLYSAILKSAYMHIKQVDEQAVVLSGGLAPAGNEDGDIAPNTFIRSLYELNTTQNFDGIAVHPYTYPFSPLYQYSWNSWQEMIDIRRLMVEHGDGNKPIWITEIGAPTGGQGDAHDTTKTKNFIYGQDYMTETSQAFILNTNISLFLELDFPTGPFFWYSLKDNGTDKSTPENFFGLLRFDNSKKPAYDVYQKAIKRGS